MDLLWALVNSYGYGSNSLSALWIVLVIVLALILGPLAESNLRRSLLLSQGSASIFFTRPICIFFLLLAVLSLCWPLLRKVLSNRKKAA